LGKNARKPQGGYFLTHTVVILRYFKAYTHIGVVLVCNHYSHMVEANLQSIENAYSTIKGFKLWLLSRGLLINMHLMHFCLNAERGYEIACHPSVCP